MADVRELVVKPEYQNKLVSISDFRKRHNIKAQAVDYLIRNDKIDYVEIDDRVRFIVDTEKTLNYSPNNSPKRVKPQPKEKPEPLKHNKVSSILGS